MREKRGTCRRTWIGQCQENGQGNREGRREIARYRDTEKYRGRGEQEVGDGKRDARREVERGRGMEGERERERERERGREGEGRGREGGKWRGGGGRWQWETGGRRSRKMVEGGGERRGRWKEQR